MMETLEAMHTPSLDRSNRYGSTYRIRRSRNMTPEIHNSKLRLLTKQIKNNDTTQILGYSPLTWAGTREDLEVADAEKREVVMNLTTLRKKLDETRDLYTKKEVEMNKKKDEIEKMKSNEAFFGNEKYKTYCKLDMLKNALQMQKIKLEEALMSKKTYEGMLDRMKKDTLTDKIKTKKLEKDLTLRARTLSNESRNTRKVHQFRMQTQNVFGEVIKQVEEEDKRRQENLYLFEKAVISKEHAERSREERIKRTENLAEIVAKEAANNDAKQYRSLLLVHKFLHLFMKKQMDNEMKRNRKVEQAFQRIKATVGIADAQQLVEKFVKREETYSELLVSISTHEKKIEEAKRMQEERQKKVKYLKERNAALDKEQLDRKNEPSNFAEVYKEFTEKTETHKLAKFKFEQSLTWAIRVLITMDKAAQQMSPQNYFEIYPKGQTVSAVLRVIQLVSEHFRAIKNQKNYTEILDDIEKTNIEPEITRREFLLKNRRVKDDEVMSDRRRSFSSNRSPTRSHTPWEDKHEEKSEDEATERALEAQRRDIKAHFAQALYYKRLKEKENEEQK